MGAGNLTDDFIADKALAKLIHDLARRGHPVDLVLNGDIFDFLKCPVRLFPEAHYPRHVTPEDSLDKLDLIYKAHLSVFEALKDFAAVKDKTIYFIIGNHDPDIVYPQVQHEIERLLGNKERVKFPGLKYVYDSVYIEHGHQYDFLFQVNFENLFLNHKGRSILNLPYITMGLISTFMRLKEEHPFLERIFPRPALMSHHHMVARKVRWHTINYFLKSLLYYPFRFYSDPTYTFPTNFLREFYTKLRTFKWEVDNITHIFSKKFKNEPYKIYVLGHIHEKMLSRNNNRVIIHPGSWRDEYDFQQKTRELIPRTKRYVEINFEDDGKCDYELVDTKIKRSIINFDAVLDNEYKFLKQVAKEEDYLLRI